MVYPLFWVDIFEEGEEAVTQLANMVYVPLRIINFFIRVLVFAIIIYLILKFYDKLPETLRISFIDKYLRKNKHQRMKDEEELNEERDTITMLDTSFDVKKTSSIRRPNRPSKNFLSKVYKCYFHYFLVFDKSF